MKKIVLVLLLVQGVFAQPTTNSLYLQAPERMFGYVDSCARFWMKSYDPVNGGFYVDVDRAGNPFGSSGKNTLNQSRNAYGFIRAFQMTGDTVYLRYARHALDFMYEHAWDNTYDGWHNNVGGTGTPSSPDAPKEIFFQHYALVGIVAAFEATRDTTDWRWLKKGYEYNDTHLWDADTGTFGYYDYVSADGTAPTNKSFNGTVDAITTHALHLYLLTGEQKYKTRLLELADIIINRLAASAPFQEIGFAERYNSSWEILGYDDVQTRSSMGHVLKAAWCLARIYELENDPLFLSTARDLVQNVLDKGYDHQYGGPYKDYNRTTGEMLMFGITDTAKAWWQMEQAVTAGLMLYPLTGEEKYLKMADETVDFFMNYFVDHEYGEVFENTNKYGGMIPQWGTTKGNAYKAGYHSIELGYYTYLYGKLLVKKEAASLYYSFASQDSARSLRMRPISAPDGYLKIASVTCNDTVYTDYDSVNLVLNLPANVGGIFYVTYTPADMPVSVARASGGPEGFALYQNYPNPFNPVTTIKYTVGGTGSEGRGAEGTGTRGLGPALSGVEGLGARRTRLVVYDVLGRQVATLVDEVKAPGSYEVRFDGSGLSSGVYFYRFTVGAYAGSRKMVLLK